MSNTLHTYLWNEATQSTNDDATSVKRRKLNSETEANSGGEEKYNKAAALLKFITLMLEEDSTVKIIPQLVNATYKLIRAERISMFTFAPDVVF